MKLTIYPFSVVILLSFLLIGCSSDDENTDSPQSEWGSIQLKFENQFKNLSPIILNQTVQTSSNGQKHLFSKLQYIISNITLTNSSGQSFSYHYNNPDKGAFIIDQNNAILNEISLDLDSIPAGTYTKVKFGLGISQDSYLLGLDNQGHFWSQASNAGMTWSWAAGYIFVVMEGKYGVESPETVFANHTGNMGEVAENGTPDLYREVELVFPTALQVSGQGLPAIHIIADFNQFLSGETDIWLDETNQVGMGSSEHLEIVSNNLSKMFSIDHIHQN
jgi:hypothetical protein